MNQTPDMIAAHPVDPPIDSALIDRCIQACFDCVQACTICADACLAEDNRDALLRCISLDQDCADVCTATGRLLSRLTEMDWTLVRAQIQACVLACRRCGAECERHASNHEHCAVTAEACRACEEACNAVLAATLTMESQVNVDSTVEQTFPASDPPSTEGSIAPSPSRAAS